MPTTVPYLRLTNGTTTLNLVDGTNYALERGTWAPRIARRRRSTLGGRPYERVVEEIPVIVRGATAATALANLTALSQLLDQAERWYDGESFDAVRIVYQPQGSILASPLESLILRRADDDFALPPTFNDVGLVLETTVVLRFERDGSWYGPEEAITVARSAHPSIGSGTFATFASHLSPVKVALGPLPEQLTIAAYDTGYLLVADRAARLELISAETMTVGPFTSTADAARKPEGTGVLVYTPADTAEHPSALKNITLDAGKRVGIVAAVRNSHATTEFAVRVAISGPAERSLASTRPYIVDALTTDPRVVLLGIVLCEEAYAGVRLHVQASAAAGTLSIDYLALVNLDNPTSRILAIGPVDVTKSIPSPETSSLTVDPRPLSALTPQVRLIGTVTPALDYAVPDWYRGDAFLLSLGTTIAVLYCGRSGTYWVPYDTVRAASIDADFVLTRRAAYLAPV